MELLVESIAGELGPKWVARLELPPRGRYKIDTEHFGKQDAERYKNCVRDLISLWRASKQVTEIRDEREVILRLLCALKKVQGFEKRAAELGKTHGVILEVEKEASSVETHPPDPQRTPASSSTLHTRLPAHSKPVEVTVRHSVPELSVTVTPTNQRRPESPLQNNVVVARKTLPAQHLVDQLDSEPCPEPQPTEHWRDILNTPIDLKITTHKFAILDLAQRLTIDRWQQLASELSLSGHRELMQRLKKEKAIEEKFYKLLKEWVRLRKEEATFAALQDALEACSQNTALRVVHRRLSTRNKVN